MYSHPFEWSGFWSDTIFSLVTETKSNYKLTQHQPSYYYYVSTKKRLYGSGTVGSDRERFSKRWGVGSHACAIVFIDTRRYVERS